MKLNDLFRMEIFPKKGFHNVKLTDKKITPVHREPTQSQSVSSLRP